LSADPGRFQFRHGHDATDGTVRELPAEKFDPNKCPPLLAWRDPTDDSENVVDGHHRLAWAERDGAKRIPVQFISAKTADEAKRIGQQANMSAAPARTFSAHVEPPTTRVPAPMKQSTLLSALMPMLSAPFRASMYVLTTRPSVTSSVMPTLNPCVASGPLMVTPSITTSRHPRERRASISAVRRRASSIR
jgi:hypothetical protein